MRADFATPEVIDLVRPAPAHQLIRRGAVSLGDCSSAGSRMKIVPFSMAMIPASRHARSRLFTFSRDAPRRLPSSRWDMPRTTRAPGCGAPPASAKRSRICAMRASTSRNSTSSSLLGGPAQPFAQNAEQLARYDRPFEQRQKRTARDDQQFAIGHRRRVGRTLLPVEQRDLAENLPLVDNVEDELLPV